MCTIPYRTLRGNAALSAAVERERRLLSPFDNLICDRDRTEHLWDFVYRNEIYMPKHKRRFGSYVMPELAGSG
jgi:uncharacterized protein YcaQ